MAGRILVIDDVATNRIILKVRLQAASYQPTLAGNGADGLRLIRDMQPDLIIIDLMLPDMSGVDVLRKLYCDPISRDIPIIALCAAEDKEARLAALEAGADDVFAKPYDHQQLLARVRNLLRARQELTELVGDDPEIFLTLAEAPAGFSRPPDIAIVSDIPDCAVRLRRCLAPHLGERIHGLSQLDALRGYSSPSRVADLYLIDASSGIDTMRALRLVSELRSNGATRHVGICLLIPSHPYNGETLMGFDLGADAVFSRDLSAIEMAQRLRAVLRRKGRADQRRESVQDGLRMAMYDPLTGLHNRRYATARLTAIANQSRQSGRGFALMIADLDRFKSINDRFGHGTGDQVLVEVAQRIANQLREGDLLARIGGEEFLIVLPGLNVEEARHRASIICQSIAQTPIATDAGIIAATISIGLSHSNYAQCIGAPNRTRAERQCDRLNEMVMREADQALLQAKAEGRNQVCVSVTTLADTGCANTNRQRSSAH